MLTREEALEMLKNTKVQDKPARVNPIFTHQKFIDFVRGLVEKMSENSKLSGIYEKRVWQAYKNQKQPSFQK